MRRLSLTALAVSALWPLCTVAQPWTPAASQPNYQGGYQGGYQPYGLQPAQPAPWSMPPPAGPQQWSNPPDYPPAQRPMPPRDRDETPWSQRDDDWTAPQDPSAPPRLDVRRRTTEKAYIVELRLDKLAPDQIEVRPVARGLLIQHHVARHFKQHQVQPYGRGYEQHQDMQRSASSRRIGLPPDADVTAMTREVKPGRLVIRIPRAAPSAGGRW